MKARVTRRHPKALTMPNRERPLLQSMIAAERLVYSVYLFEFMEQETFQPHYNYNAPMPGTHKKLHRTAINPPSVCFTIN